MVPGKLYVLGGYTPADGRVTWLPAGLSGYQPSNSYLLLDSERAILLDTGLACFASSVLKQLATVLPTGMHLSVFLTRPELDCIGNLGPIVDTFPVDVLHTGGTNNPFDAFDNVSVVIDGKVAIHREMGRPLPLSDTRSLQILNGPLRLLPTYWAYDDETRTLFTSDSFGHNLVRKVGDSRIITRAGDDLDEQVAAHLDTKFDWMSNASTEAIEASLTEVFEAREVEMIAPDNGCVISGRIEVNRHVGAVLKALSRPRRRSLNHSAAYSHPTFSPMLASAANRGSDRALPREVAPSIYWMGGCLSPPAASVTYHLHNSPYLLMGSRSTLLIDTGHPAHWRALDADLDRVLGGRGLDWVFPTHLETPHCGNVNRLLAKFPAARVFADARDYHLHYPTIAPRCLDRRAGAELDLGDMNLVLLEAVIRDLPATLWAYERSRQVLFVADAFGYTHGATGAGDPIHRPGECALLSSELPSLPSVEQVTYLTIASLYWTRFVDVVPYFEQVEDLMQRYPTAVIAPAHANVITDLPALMPVMRDAFRALSQGVSSPGITGSRGNDANRAATEPNHSQRKV